MHLLETLGHHLGVAIENQRLKLRDKQLAISEERNLLAQELHDSIAQGLAFLNIQVQLLQDSLHKGRVDEALQTAGQLREGVQESYDDVRELLVHFRTRVHQSDLDTAIQTVGTPAVIVTRSTSSRSSTLTASSPESVTSFVTSCGCILPTAGSFAGSQRARRRVIRLPPAA